MEVSLFYYKYDGIIFGIIIYMLTNYSLDKNHINKLSKELQLNSEQKKIAHDIAVKEQWDKYVLKTRLKNQKEEDCNGIVTGFK